MMFVRTCRVCGCTDHRACMTMDGPCSWVELDLCSACDDSEAVSIYSEAEANAFIREWREGR